MYAVRMNSGDGDVDIFKSDQLKDARAYLRQIEQASEHLYESQKFRVVKIQNSTKKGIHWLFVPEKDKPEDFKVEIMEENYDVDFDFVYFTVTTQTWKRAFNKYNVWLNSGEYDKEVRRVVAQDNERGWGEYYGE